MLNFVSLFCGCGGFDLGFIDAGYNCIAAFDHDPIAIDAHRRNLGSRAEVTDLSNSRLCLGQLPDVDVVIAGPPCQGFSTIGKRDPRDPRNTLLLSAGEIATFLRPKLVVIENVAGAKAGEQRRYWWQLNSMLRNAGYGTAELQCDATKFGLAQTRKRLVLIAWNSRKAPDFKMPVRDGGTLRGAIDKINGAPNHAPEYLAADGTLKKIARRIAPGQKLCNVRGGARAVHTWDIPEVFGPTTSWERQVLETLLMHRRRERVREVGDADPVSGHFLYRQLGRSVAGTLRVLQRKGYVRRIGDRYDLVHTFNGKFRRLHWDRPSLTVDTRFGDPRYFLHPDEDRGFTVREAARIQGFPDRFVFDGPRSAQYRLIGNAVPPPLAKHLALYLRDAIVG